MDNLALSLSKSITEFLDQNEKRLTRQNSQQEKHDKLLVDLNNRVEQLETRCQELMMENKSLKSDLEVVKQREDTAMRDMITTKSDLEKMQTRVNECQEWVRLITALTQEVHNLNESKKAQDKKVEDLINNQAELTTKLDKQQRHLNATANTAQAAAAAAASASATVSASLRSTTTNTTTAPQYSIKTPSRSPSTASFFNGNMNRLQSSTPRYKPTTNNLFNNNLSHHNNHHQIHNHHSHLQPDQFQHQEPDYNGSIDANDGMLSEMSDHAESLLNQVQVLNDLHQRSFGGGSVCSDEG